MLATVSLLLGKEKSHERSVFQTINQMPMKVVASQTARWTRQSRRELLAGPFAPEGAGEAEQGENQIDRPEGSRDGCKPPK
jgi:hypothetical protein